MKRQTLYQINNMLSPTGGAQMFFYDEKLMVYDGELKQIEREEAEDYPGAEFMVFFLQGTPQKLPEGVNKAITDVYTVDAWVTAEKVINACITPLKASKVALVKLSEEGGIIRYFVKSA